jgi:hypothetical protein
MQTRVFHICYFTFSYGYSIFVPAYDSCPLIRSEGIFHLKLNVIKIGSARITQYCGAFA